MNLRDRCFKAEDRALVEPYFKDLAEDKSIAEKTAKILKEKNLSGRDVGEQEWESYASDFDKWCMIWNPGRQNEQSVFVLEVIYLDYWYNGHDVLPSVNHAFLCLKASGWTFADCNNPESIKNISLSDLQKIDGSEEHEDLDRFLKSDNFKKRMGELSPQNLVREIPTYAANKYYKVFKDSKVYADQQAGKSFLSKFWHKEGSGVHRALFCACFTILSQGTSTELIAVAQHFLQQYALSDKKTYKDLAVALQFFISTERHADPVKFLRQTVDAQQGNHYADTVRAAWAEINKHKKDYFSSLYGSMSEAKVESKAVQVAPKKNSR